MAISQTPAVLLVGTLVNGRFRVKKLLGYGGYGNVYLVEDQAVFLGNLYAMKESLSSATSERRQFTREAKWLMALDHPNLPRVAEQFEWNTRPYFVMAYVAGENLEDRVDRLGPLPEDQVLGWMRPICDAVIYLHSQKRPIIHRDIKPGNIIVTKDGRPWLVDFGIAKVLQPGTSRKTTRAARAVSGGYSPLEQYTRGGTDARSDVYALGVTLHQLLTNYDPSSTPFSLPPIHTLNPTISPHVQAAIEKAIRLKREERFESISDFHAALFAPGAFVFRGGQRAATVPELVALSRQLPLEAEEHLYAGRYELWLRTMGERKLSKVARSVRGSKRDHAQGLEVFLREAEHASGIIAGKGAATTAAATAARASTTIGGIQIQPGMLDIGPLVAGQAGVTSFTVAGAGGKTISGEVKPLASWLHIFPARFSGPSTLIEVRADTTTLSGTQKYQGGIQISSDGQRLIMPVSVEVLGNHGPGMLTGPQARMRNRILKYSWPPLRQIEIVQQATSAMMGFGLALATLLVVQQTIGFHGLTSLLSSPYFPLLLIGWALVTTAGALIGRWGASLERRALTGAVCALTSLGLIALLWTSWFQPKALNGASSPEALLVTTLAAGSVAAAFGASPAFSGFVLRILGAIARRATLLIFIGLLILGGYIGYLVTSDIPLPILKPIGIVVGIIAGAALAIRLNRYIRRIQRQQAKP